MLLRNKIVKKYWIICRMKVNEVIVNRGIMFGRVVFNRSQCIVFDLVQLHIKTYQVFCPKLPCCSYILLPKVMRVNLMFWKRAEGESVVLKDTYQVINLSLMLMLSMLWYFQTSGRFTASFK